MARPKFIIPPVKTSTPVAGIDKELLTKTVDDGVYPLAMAKEIRLDRIQPDPDQPRRTWDQAKLEELAASIHEQGILQPIVVEYVDEGNYFKLIHGERRWRAAHIAGLQTLPAIIRKVDDNTKLVRQLIENIQREDLNDVDRARALKQLKVNLGSPSWEVIADRVGISKRRVLQIVDITKLPAPIQEDIRSGQLTEKHGRAAKMLPEEMRLGFAEAVRHEQLSGDESMAVAKALKATPEVSIDEAVTQIKERKLRPTKPSGEHLEPPESPGASAPPIGEAAPAVIPAPEAAPALPSSAASAQLAADPLAELLKVPAAIRALDLSNVDSQRLLPLLEEIVAAATDVLGSIAQAPA